MSLERSADSGPPGCRQRVDVTKSPYESIRGDFQGAEIKVLYSNFSPFKLNAAALCPRVRLVPFPFNILLKTLNWSR